MVVNLFSLFDPAGCGMFSNLWLSLGFGLMLFTASLHTTPSGVDYCSESVSVGLKQEMDPLLSRTRGWYTSALWVKAFMAVLALNFMGLVPYCLTSSSFLAVPLAASLTLWLGPVMAGAYLRPSSWVAHLVPVGTPGPLLPLMVLIETVSLLIRPVTLAVRLVANMLAGHLLLALLGEGVSLATSGSLVLLAQTGLCLLEIAVAMLQAYVFTVLLALYSQDNFVGN